MSVEHDSRSIEKEPKPSRGWIRPPFALPGVQSSLMPEPPVHQCLKHPQTGPEVFDGQEWHTGFDDHFLGHASEQDRRRAAAAARGDDNEIDVARLDRKSVV